jgi:hypothetical protein
MIILLSLLLFRTNIKTFERKQISDPLLPRIFRKNEHHCEIANFTIVISSALLWWRMHYTVIELIFREKNI